MTVASISETTKPIKKIGLVGLPTLKFQDNIWTTKVCTAMQYYDVLTNPRWRTAAILEIVKSPYLGENRLILMNAGTLQQILNQMSHVTKN